MTAQRRARIRHRAVSRGGQRADRRVLAEGSAAQDARCDADTGWLRTGDVGRNCVGASLEQNVSRRLTRLLLDDVKPSTVS